MAKWDWYQTTVIDASEPADSGLVSALLAAWPLSDWAPARNLNGYTHGGAIVRGDRVLCHLCWGGQPGVNCKATSDESPILADALAASGFTHSPTRVDACEDWDSAGLFDQVSARLIEFAESSRLAICQQGDWVRGQARTLYIGSKASPVRLVLYEKGYEQGGGASLDWVRLEVRVRPKGQHRSAVASWSPGQAFGAGWVPKALESIGWSHLERYKVGTVWRVSDSDRARRAMVRQYHRVIAEWAAELGGVEKLGAAMVSEIENMLDDKQKKHGNTAQPEAGRADCLQ